MGCGAVGILKPEFPELCEFIEDNKFKVVIVEGPRGVGKTTFCGRLLDDTELVYYKTWGTEQKLLRCRMERSLSLDLPQGTYFVLDFVKQIPLVSPVLADRGNLSAIAYQCDLPYGTNSKLHEYYVSLMRDSRTLLLNLTGPEDKILQRRIGRAGEDESRLYELPLSVAKEKVRKDCERYWAAIDKMVTAGLDEVGTFELEEGFICWAYTAKGLDIILPPEEINVES